MAGVEWWFLAIPPFQQLLPLPVRMHAALEVVWAEATGRVRKAFEPKAVPAIRSAPKWTAKQWSTVLHAIRQAPYHAVSLKSLEGMGVTGEVVESLLEHNFVALRHFSELAQDLPAVVYGDFRDKVVTAVNAAHLEYICSGDWDKVWVSEHVVACQPSL